MITDIYKISSYKNFEEINFAYLDYDKILNSLKDFDILLVHYPYYNNYNLLKLLMYLLKKYLLGIKKLSHYYDHAALVIFEKDENGEDECYVYEAVKYVKKTKLKYWLEKNRAMAISVYRYKDNKRTSDEKVRDYVKAALYSCISKSYSNIRFFIYSFMELITGYWVGSRNSCAFHSAELVAYIYYLLTNQKIFKEFFGFNAKTLHNTIKYKTDWFENVGNYYIDNRKVFKKYVLKKKFNINDLNLSPNIENHLLNLHHKINKLQ